MYVTRVRLDIQAYIHAYHGPSVCGGDAALRQITSIICYYYYSTVTFILLRAVEVNIG